MRERSGSIGFARAVLVGLTIAEMTVAGCSTPGTNENDRVRSAQQATTQDPPPSVPLNPPTSTPVGVGTLPGNLDVTSGGIATYHIPIDVPAGPRGMQPAVALSYSSARGYGMVGGGWSLSPRSAVTRCPKSFANHAQPKGVVVDTTDSFCLDGELLWTQRRNGLDNADYRLRVGRQTKITGVGSTDTVQSGFEVRPGNGAVRYYGAMRDPAAGVVTNGSTINYVEGSTAKPVAWLLREERDPYNNRIVYDYESANNTYRLQKISYGFVNGQATRTVELTYRGKITDYKAQGWDMGVHSHMDYLLDRITTKVHGEVAFTYELRYDHDPFTWRERLAGVTKCTRSETCLPETTFEYQSATHGFTKLVQHPYNGKKFPLGSNAPKEWDNLWIPYADLDVTVNGEELKYANALHILDANGDGKADLIGRTEAALDVEYAYNNQTISIKTRRPERWFAWGYESEPSYTTQSMAPARMDEALSYLNVVTGVTDTTIVAQTENRVVTSLPTFTGRFDVDGLDDVIEPLAVDPWMSEPPGETQGVARGFHVMYSQKGPDPDGEVEFLSASFELPDAQTHPIVSYLPVDANGDGLNDMLFCKSSGAMESDDDFTRTKRMPGRWHLLMNESGSFWSSAQAGGQNLGIVCDADDLLLLLDYDGDGRVDPLVVSVRDESFNKYHPWQWTNYQAFLFHNAGNEITVTRTDTGLPPDKLQRYSRSRQRAKCHWFDSGTERCVFEKTGQAPGDPWWRDHMGSPTHIGGVSDDKVMDVNGDGLKDIVRMEYSYAPEGGELLTATEAHPGMDKVLLTKLGASTAGLAYPGGFPVDAHHPAKPYLVVWFNTGHGFTRGGGGSTQQQSYWRGYGVNERLTFKGFQRYSPYDYDLDGKEELLGNDQLGEPGECTWNLLTQTSCDNYAKILRFDVVAQTWNSEYGLNATRQNLTPPDVEQPAIELTWGGPSGDYDGDGVVDVTEIENDTLTIWRRNSKPADLLVKVTNGLQHQTTVTYATGLEARSYKAPEGLLTNPTDPVGPQIRGFSTGPVVRARTEYTEGTDDPTDQVLMTTYRYSDLRIDLYGRMAPYYKVTQSDAKRIDRGIHHRKVKVAGNVGWNSQVRDYEQATPSLSFSSTNYDVSAPLSLQTNKAMAVTIGSTKQRILPHSGIWHTKYRSETKYETYEVPIPEGDPCQVDFGPTCGPARVAGLAPTRSTVTSVPSDKVNEIGLPLESTTVSGDRTIVTKYEWSNLGEPWVIGMLTKTIATETFQGETLTRTTSSTFNNRGVIETTTREPDQAPYKQALTRIYTPEGNVSSASLTTGEGASRWMLLFWDADHVFPVTSQNALGHENEQVWDSRLGVILESKSENGFVEKTAHDDFGRPRWKRAFRYGQPIDPGTMIDIDAPGPTAHPKARLQVRRTVEGHGVTFSDYDALGRLLYQKAPGFGGQESYVTHAYDGFGLFNRHSLPAFDGQPPAGSTVTYFNPRGMKTAEVNADGTSREFQYGSFAQPFTTWWHDENQNWHRSVGNQYGQIERTLDGYALNANGGPANDDAEMCFFYRVGGRLRTTIPCNGILNPNWEGPQEKVIEYDLLGRLTSQQDPQHGLSLTSYTGFDEIKTVTAAGHTVLHEYDILGRRRVRRVFQCPDPGRPCQGSVNLVSTSTWDYDVKMIGALDKVTGDTGNTQEPFYNGAGRVDRIQYGIQGEIFEYGYAYDLLGRPLAMRYPVGAGQPPVVVQNEYDAFGVLEKVVDANNPSHEFWNLSSVDAAGRITEESHGQQIWNRYVFDPENGNLTELESLNPNDTFQHFQLGHDDLGNVTSREDLLFNQSETFHYDEKNRLDNVETTTQGGVTNITTYFDRWGNITQKAASAFQYDSKLRLESGAGVTFTYDDFGRALTRSQGLASSTFAYNWFSKPYEIQSSGDTLRFDYDAAFARVSKESMTTGAKTIYAGELYERASDPNLGVDVHTFTITARGKNVAQIHRQVEDGVAVDQVRYLSTDHLGSTSLVTTKDEQGMLEILERPSYDAWGQRRSHLWGQALQVPDHPVTIGFTGHLSGLEGGVMNMRGRFYDPTVGRFLTPDPIVQSPTDMRSHNRYSYVWNNPLNATDPTGFEMLPPPGPGPGTPPGWEMGDGTEGWTPCGPMACPQDPNAQPIDPGMQGSTTQTSNQPPPKPVTTIARDTFAPPPVVHLNDQWVSDGPNAALDMDDRGPAPAPAAMASPPPEDPRSKAIRLWMERRQQDGPARYARTNAAIGHLLDAGSLASAVGNAEKVAILPGVGRLTAWFPT
ncbi:MAG TPA: RHS repeat-associated core domain-containing protein, partial [Polyangiaceae bacterium]|nr:RHS repeat-associated core domain-containing protein [Polyangiaceae bacterium]